MKKKENWTLALSAIKEKNRKSFNVSKIIDKMQFLPVLSIVIEKSLFHNCLPTKQN